MSCHRIIIFGLIFCFVMPISSYAKAYRYIDKDGVERFSNEPPPAGAKIIGEEAEIKYDEAADKAQQDRTQRAADAIANQPAAPPPPKKSPAPAVEAGGAEGTGEKGYSRRKHRRKKQIRKEKAEAKKAMEGAAAEEGKK